MQPLSIQSFGTVINDRFDSNTNYCYAHRFLLKEGRAMLATILFAQKYKLTITPYVTNTRNDFINHRMVRILKVCAIIN